MPKENIFSGKYEPDRDTCTEANESNVARFRTAMLKLDRIHNDENEKDLTENIMQLCSRNNKTGEKINLSESYEFEDAMDWLEKVYNDVDADLMIMAIDQLAERYGYTSDMDETIEIKQEQKWYSTETFESVINKSIRTYSSLPTEKQQKDFKTRIAAGYRLYEMESQPRPQVHRGENWVVEVPTGIGRETTGMRWSLIISKKQHATNSDTVNIVYIAGEGEGADESPSRMQITNSDLEAGRFTKNPSRVNLTDIYTIDKKRLKRYIGKVNSAFMQKVMTRIASQIGITLGNDSVIEDKE